MQRETLKIIIDTYMKFWNKEVKHMIINKMPNDIEAKFHREKIL